MVRSKSQNVHVIRTAFLDEGGVREGQFPLTVIFYCFVFYYTSSSTGHF